MKASFKKILATGGILTASLSSIGAWSADSSVDVVKAPPLSSVADVSAEKRSDFLDRLYVNYFAIYHGASLNNFSSPYSADRTGKPGNFPINLDSELFAAYMITQDVGIGPDLPFLVVPVMGKGFVMGDFGVKAFNKKTISYKGLDVYTNLIIQAPTSQDAQQRGMSLGVKSTPYARYNIPHSRFTLGAWTEIKAYLGVDYGKAFKLYGQPYVKYQMLKDFALNLGWEYETRHNIGTSAFDFTAYQSDLQPGVIWNITPKIMVNPYVQVFTTNQVSADNMALGAVISATLL